MYPKNINIKNHRCFETIKRKGFGVLEFDYDTFKTKEIVKPKKLDKKFIDKNLKKEIIEDMEDDNENDWAFWTGSCKNREISFRSSFNFSIKEGDKSGIFSYLMNMSDRFNDYIKKNKNNL